MRRWALAAALGLAAPMFASPAVTAETAETARPARVLSATMELGIRSARDDLIVPRASTGPGFGGAGQFLGTFGPGLLDTQLRLRFAGLFDRDGRPAAGISHALRLGYLPIWRVARTSWSVAAGLLLAWETDVLWLAEWDDAHTYWMGRRFLGVGARTWRPIGTRWRVDASAAMNLLGFESRPPAYRHNVQDGLTRFDYYLAHVHRRAKFGSLFNWQTLELGAQFSRSTKDAPTSIGWSLGGELRLLHAARPAMAFLFETNLRLSHGWDL